MIDSNSEVLKCFWLPPQYYNECISGASANTIRKRGVEIDDQKNRKYFYDTILPSLRDNTIPYQPSKKYLSKSKRFPDGFREIVNDALKAVYCGGNGYVFNITQLAEILKFIPSANVVFQDGIYYVSKRR